MKRKSTKQLLGTYVQACVLSLFIVYALWAIWGIGIKEERARAAAKGSRVELAQLETRKSVLEGNLAELATGRGQEALVRQTRGVAKEGEEVIIVVPQTATSTPPRVPWWKNLFKHVIDK